MMAPSLSFSSRGSALPTRRAQTRLLFLATAFALSPLPVAADPNPLSQPHPSRTAKLSLLPGPNKPHRILLEQRFTKILNTTRSVARQKIPYVFGGTDAKGIDCSASVQHLYRLLGCHLPRTSESQANYLAKNARLWRVAPWESEKQIFARLQSGDLLFWANSSNPNKISHVMMFIDTDDGTSLRLWGARGRGKTGLTGSGVDYFTYRAGSRRKSRLVAYGRPGI